MGKPFVFAMPVRFADVDHAGIVYYPHFYHYFHQTFEEFFAHHLGSAAYLELLDERKIGFPAVASECQYKAPLRFGDTVEVEMELVRAGARSITIEYRAFRLRDGEAARTLAAVGKVVSAIVDLGRFVAVELPADLRRLFATISPDSGG